jgi:SAM-dependent methyltransferase
LGQGVGAKVWFVAVWLCRELSAHPEIVSGLKVLEIGAGCGACGVAAAKLGAAEVVITDYVDSLLVNLAETVRLNFGEGDETGSARGGGSGIEGEEGADPIEWEAGPAKVRFMDWNDSLMALPQAERARLVTAPPPDDDLPSRSSLKDTIGGDDDDDGNGNGNGNGGGISDGPCALDGPSTRGMVPSLDEHDTFDVILGTDILYEWPMAASVAAALLRHLRPGGRALLCCAVRDAAMFDGLLANMRALGLRVGCMGVDPDPGDDGLLGSGRDYEGGFRLIGVERAEAPAVGWHRDMGFEG